MRHCHWGHWGHWLIVIVVGVTMVIGIISIQKLGNDDAKQMLILLCETGQKDLNLYFDSVEQSVSTVSTLVEEDLNSIKKDQFSEHIEHMRSVFEKAVLPANEVLAYYYRIDPKYSDSEKGFWYSNTCRRTR